ncbi:hypothetical protein LTR53_013780 [Teratosphaeriaceae sp. CCFEE 6253]|nr:hypothetical protein LTR53_013780 [Teratosphaeriaceae sp. CCFEE 6253]
MARIKRKIVTEADGYHRTTNEPSNPSLARSHDIQMTRPLIDLVCGKPDEVAKELCDVIACNITGVRTKDGGYLSDTPVVRFKLLGLYTQHTLPEMIQMTSTHYRAQIDDELRGAKVWYAHEYKWATSTLEYRLTEERRLYKESGKNSVTEHVAKAAEGDGEGEKEETVASLLASIRHPSPETSRPRVAKKVKRAGRNRDGTPASEAVKATKDRTSNKQDSSSPEGEDSEAETSAMPKGGL